MDQETIVVTDGRRTWTPLRALLLALAAIAGGLLLSIALGGPARADSPSTPPEPAATSADTSLVGQVTGALGDVTRTALAPVDDLVATVESGPAAHAAPPAPTSTAPADAVSAASDGVLAEVPLSATPVWRDVVGSQPVQQIVTPLAAVLRPLAPGVADLLAPLLTPASASGANATGASFGSPVGGVPTSPRDPVSAASVPGTPPGSVRHVDQPSPAPRTPFGVPDDEVLSASGGAMAPAVLLAFPAILLLVAATARRRDWTLPRRRHSAPTSRPTDPRPPRL